MLRQLYWYWYFRYGAYEETLIDKYVAFLPHPFSFSGDEDEVIVFSHIDCEGHRGLFHRSRSSLLLPTSSFGQTWFEYRFVLKSSRPSKE